MGARELIQDLTGVGLTITLDGDRLLVSPRDLLTDDLRQAITAAKLELLDLLRTSTPSSAEPVTEVDSNRYAARRDRLLRWGWSKQEAEALALRLMRRDHDIDDDRVCCADCQHYRPWTCGNYRSADIPPAVGRDLASLLQRCDGFRCTIERGVN